MRKLLDGLINIIMIMLLIFICSVFTLSEIQMMSARHLHTSILNQVQSSYYQLSDAEINAKVHEKMPDSWYFETKPVVTYSDRKDMLVTLHYDISMPLFGITKTGQIDGYAR